MVFVTVKSRTDNIFPFHVGHRVRISSIYVYLGDKVEWVQWKHKSSYTGFPRAAQFGKL